MPDNGEASISIIGLGLRAVSSEILVPNPQLKLLPHIYYFILCIKKVSTSLLCDFRKSAYKFTYKCEG